MFTALNARPTLHRLVDDVVRDVAGPALGMATTHQPFDAAYDIRTSAEEIVVECDLPGVTEDDLEITLENQKLVVKGQRRYRGNDDERVWLGRRYGAFQKTFTLPDVVDAERLTAQLHQGVLTLRVPRRPEAKPRRIPIGGGNEAKRLGE